MPLWKASDDHRPGPAPAPLATPAARPRIFSGIQPSGIVHLGNELGAVRNYVRLQYEYEAIYCIVDYHALTSTHDADLLRSRTREMAASLLALGLDPDHCTLFVQSHRRSTRSSPGCSRRSRRSAGSSERPPTRRRRTPSPTTSITASSPTRSCRPPTSSSTRRRSSRSARTRRHTWSCRARSSAPSTAATATPSRSRKPCSPRLRSCSVPTASRR